MAALAEELKKGLQHAAQHLKTEEYHEALRTLKTLYKSYPKDPMVNGLLASSYAALKMIDKAEKHYLDILNLDNNNHLARFQYGMLYFQQANYKKALDIWQLLLALESEYICKFFSAQANYFLGDKEDALNLVNASLNSTPKNHPLYHQIVSFQQTLDQQ